MKPTILASKRFEGYDFPVDGIRRLIEYGRNTTLGYVVMMVNINPDVTGRI
jgi:hypothetical protein